MSHGDEVTHAPPGAVVLSGNGHSAVQAMAVTRNGTESWFVQRARRAGPRAGALTHAPRREVLLGEAEREGGPSGPLSGLRGRAREGGPF